MDPDGCSFHTVLSKKSSEERLKEKRHAETKNTRSFVSNSTSYSWGGQDNNKATDKHIQHPKKSGGWGGSSGFGSPFS